MKLQEIILEFVVSVLMHSQIKVTLPTLLHTNTSWKAEATDVSTIQSSEIIFKLHSNGSYQKSSRLERTENAIGVK
jgi:hypothetical protein